MERRSGLRTPARTIGGGGSGFPFHRDARLSRRTRRILHLDVDAFLASVEQSLHPELRGRPVVVGGLPSDRNLVMSCSYEARAFGLRPGLLLQKAARLCPDAVFRRGDSQAANRLRLALVERLHRFTPRVEVTSIDDFFADLTGTARLHGAAVDAAEAIREVVWRELHLPLSIGIGTNRTLARLAGKLAKPGGVGEILPGQERDFLQHLPVEQLPGVGHSIGNRLERFAIRTVGDLQRVPREVLFASFGRSGLVLHDHARGIDDAPVEPTYTEVSGKDRRLVLRLPRTVHRDSTFEPEEGRREIVEAMLSYIVERAAHRVRRLGLCVGSLEVRVRYVDTRTPAARRASSLRSSGGEPLASARRRVLELPTDSTDRLFRHARGLLRELPRRRALVKRIGITLHSLSRSVGWQGTLFNDRANDAFATSRDDRHRRLDSALDRVRERLGFGALIRGSSWPLVPTHPLGRDGFRLRTPSLNQ